jgi:hypothetical protein
LGQATDFLNETQPSLPGTVKAQARPITILNYNYKVMDNLIKSWREKDDDLSLHSKTYIPTDEHEDLCIKHLISELHHKSVHNFNLLDHIIKENGGEYEAPKSLLVDMKL